MSTLDEIERQRKNEIRLSPFGHAFSDDLPVFRAAHDGSTSVRRWLDSAGQT